MDKKDKIIEKKILEYFKKRNVNLTELTTYICDELFLTSVKEFNFELNRILKKHSFNMNQLIQLGLLKSNAEKIIPEYLKTKTVSPEKRITSDKTTSTKKIKSVTQQRQEQTETKSNLKSQFQNKTIIVPKQRKPEDKMKTKKKDPVKTEQNITPELIVKPVQIDSKVKKVTTSVVNTPYYMIGLEKREEKPFTVENKMAILFQNTKATPEELGKIICDDFNIKTVKEFEWIAQKYLDMYARGEGKRKERDLTRGLLNVIGTIIPQYMKKKEQESIKETELTKNEAQTMKKPIIDESKKTKEKLEEKEKSQKPVAVINSLEIKMEELTFNKLVSKFQEFIIVGTEDKSKAEKYETIIANYNIENLLTEDFFTIPKKDKNGNPDFNTAKKLSNETKLEVGEYLSKYNHPFTKERYRSGMQAKRLNEDINEENIKKYVKAPKKMSNI